jgi:hypothetical protein
LRSDSAAIEQRFLSDFAAIPQEYRIVLTTIARQFRGDCAAIPK